MKFAIDTTDRLALRQAALYGPSRAVRVRAVCLLHLARGRNVASLGRSLGLSRPTVYKWARVFLATRAVGDLRTEGMGRRDKLAREAIRAQQEAAVGDGVREAGELGRSPGGLGHRDNPRGPVARE